jgi:hypothetical protein
MENLLRLVIVIFVFTIGFTLYLSTPFNVVEADNCSVGWDHCRGPNGERTPSPGDRTGCSVQGDIIEGNGGIVGIYVYTCNGQKTTCYYAIKCPTQNPDPRPDPEGTPEV